MFTTLWARITMLRIVALLTMASKASLTTASGMSEIPILIVEFGMIPGLWWDCCRMQHASKAYNTKVFEIAGIDDDSKKQGVLQMQMASYQALSLTTVIPCYMPNEEEILPAVLDFE